MLGRPRGAATHWHSGRRSRSPAEGVKVRCGRVGRAGSGVWAIQQLHTLHPVGLTCIVLPRPISSPRSIRPSHRSTAAATPSRWNGSSASWSVSEAVDGIAFGVASQTVCAPARRGGQQGWPDLRVPYSCTPQCTPASGAQNKSEKETSENGTGRVPRERDRDGAAPLPGMR